MIRRSLLFLCCFSVHLGLPEIGPAQTALPPLPSGWAWQPVPDWTDEFDGAALDSTKWLDYNPFWRGREPAYFARHNVAVRGGRLQITARNETLTGVPTRYHTFTTGSVNSKTRRLYGYIEILARPMNARTSSSFWLYHSEPEWWTEIDVFEISAGTPGHERAVHMNTHVFRTPVSRRHQKWPRRWNAPFRLAEGFHVYALAWDEDYLKFYVDGTVVHMMENVYWHQPLYLNFDSETMPDWFGLPDPKTLPATYEIEYVRTWQRVRHFP